MGISIVPAHVPPELLSPAGSFESAYYAFLGGADAVYCGLSDFSARKSAVNFTRDSFRRLKTLAEQKGKKIYVTLNTVITEPELEDLSETLSFLETVQPDGVIIQDIGAAEIIRRYFPSLVLHASTQMGIHSLRGVEVLKQAGFSRVVLSRECCFDTIREIRTKCPDMEIEVFIHGALCYSFSGACLASGMILGRSGNRGECAQICRSYFDRNSKKETCFSCADLTLYEDVRKLSDIGIDSLKIEGRMKSPEYVYHTARLYRAALDGEKWEDEIEKVDTIFSRKKTKGFFYDKTGNNLIDTGYPAHYGIKIGQVERTSKTGFTLTLLQPLAVRDGLMFFENDSPLFPYRFSTAFPSARKTAERGETVTILSDRTPKKGQVVYKISSRDLDLRSINEKQFDLWKKPLPIQVIIADSHLIFSAAVGQQGFSYSFPVNIQTARTVSDIRKIISSLFTQSGDSYFIPSSMAIDIKTSVSPDRIFIRPSELKAAKNAFYSALAVVEEEEKRAKISKITSENQRQYQEKSIILPVLLARFRPLMEKSLDFASFRQLVTETAGSNVVISLPPFLHNEEAVFQQVIEYCASHSHEQIKIGLNNISHISVARILTQFPHVRFFLGIYAYCANSWTWHWWKEKLGVLLEAAVFWMEGGEQIAPFLESAGIPIVQANKNVRPPLFWSAACFEKHVVNKGICPSRCTCSFEHSAVNNKNTYLIKTEDCITRLYLKG